MTAPSLSDLQVLADMVCRRLGFPPGSDLIVGRCDGGKTGSGFRLFLFEDGKRIEQIFEKGPFGPPTSTKRDMAAALGLVLAVLDHLSVADEARKERTATILTLAREIATLAKES